MPAGGGGGGWAKMNEDMAANRAKRQASVRTSTPAGVTFGEIQNFDGAGREITGTSIFDPVLDQRNTQDHHRVVGQFDCGG
jgi:hypothetical protein